MHLLRILRRGVSEGCDHTRIQFRALRLQPGGPSQDENRPAYHLAEAIEELSRRSLDRGCRFGIQRSLTIADFGFRIADLTLPANLRVD